MAAVEAKLDIFKLVKFGSHKKFPKGQTIFLEGTFGKEMYIVLKGSVDVTTGGVLLTTLKPGSFFGEMSLLTDLPRSATCKTPEESYLLVINQDNFTKIIKEEPMLAFKLMQVMAERIRKLNIDIKLATKQLAKTTKSFSQTDNKNYNDVLENNFYEGILQKSVIFSSGYTIDEVGKIFPGDIDLACKDPYGRNFLSQAVAASSEGKLSEFMGKTMGADVPDVAGNTPIMLASMRGDIKIVQKLLDRGINVNARNLNDETALMMASAGGFTEVVKMLIEANADAARRDSTGNTALAFAAIFGRDEVAKLLISKRVDVNAADKFGNTALHHAIKCGKESIAMSLVQAGAKSTLKDKHGDTAASLAKSKSMTSLASAMSSSN